MSFTKFFQILYFRDRMIPRNTVDSNFMQQLILSTGFLLLVTYVSATQAAVDSFQSQTEITSTVIQFVQNKIQPQENVEVKIEADPLDSRLKLSRCSTPLKATMPHNSRLSARFSVTVQCESEKPWQLYVPVTVAKMANIYVANSALMKGDVVNESDLRLVKTDINQLHSRPMFSANNIVGMVAKHPIAQGSPFTENYLKFPTLIKKGESVAIVAAAGGLNIRMTGEALDSGAIGQRIRIKNASSKKIIEAIVINSNTVQVDI